MVVVSWNGLRLLQPCLAALVAQTLEHELVVVDNGSTDGTAEWVRANVSAARLLRLPENAGFAGGNNVGLRAASGDLLALVNNDTVPPPSFLQELTAPFAMQAKIGAVAGVLAFAHQPQIVASAGIDIARDGVHRDARMLERIVDLPETPVEIFGASGGAVCYRRVALADAGLFPDRFFNYLEDADLAWRLRLKGWRCMLAPRAIVPHVYSATAGHASPRKQRLLALNRWRVLIRCIPGPLLSVCAASIARYDLLAMIYGLATRNAPIVAGRLQALQELPRLLPERRHIQAHATEDPAALAAWLRPAPRPSEVLALDRRLDQILRHRTQTPTIAR